MEKLDLDIVLAKENELNEVFKLQKKAFKIYYDEYKDFDGNPYLMSIEQLKFNISFPFGKYLLLKQNNKIIGGAFYYLSDDHHHLDQLFIDPDYQGKGLGKKLLKYVLDDEDINILTTDTIYDNIAYKMYLNMGFKAISSDYEDNIHFIILEYRKIKD